MLDLIIKNVRVVRPNKNAVDLLDLLDLGIKDGKFHTIAPKSPRPKPKKFSMDKIIWLSLASLTRTCTRGFTRRLATMPLRKAVRRRKAALRRASIICGRGSII